VNCTIDKLGIAVSGEGKSRRKAEQIAAELAIAQVTSRFAGNEED